MVKVQDFDFPDDLFYTDEQIWLKKEGGNVRIGLTTFGADLAGKIKFIRLRPAGKAIKAGKSIGTMESGKWTGPIRSPVTGTLTEVNEALKANPAMLNEDPYGTGWIAVIAADDLDAEIGALQGGDGLEDWAKAQYAEKKVD